VTALEAASALPPELQSSRIVVVSDFNCPYCFTLNEWLNQLGVAARVYWVGVEHKPHLPHDFAQANRADDLETLQREVSDVRRRAPEVGVQLPPVWVNSQQALLLQAAVEAFVLGALHEPPPGPACR
jgi:predicted DsbA family dithiol-disulfide isomerase